VYNEKIYRAIHFRYYKYSWKKYGYSKSVYINNYTKIIIICPIHGEFLQTPNKHLSGRGCPKCGNFTLTLSDFINRSNQKHNFKFNYSKFVYINNKTEGIIICPIHGEFLQTPINHLNGKGCPNCKSDLISKLKRKPIEKFITDAILVHKSRYDYTDSFYVKNSNKIPINCKIHGIFYQRIQHHLDGHGCPKCHHRISKPENDFLDYLKIDKLNRQLIINRKLVDGIKDNIIYEFLGDFWHGNPEKFKDDNLHPYIKKTYKQIREKTFNKLKNLKNTGYNIKYIWENDWNRFKKGIDKIPKIQTI
jgi:hypothetical protein